ncbi:MAG: FKBP-type peptidyl-prolyl cis-trans isomerase, partial [Fibrobacteraceae bacterium]
MSYLRFIPILLLPAYLMAIPYQVKTIREGSGDPVKKGQLIKVNYKGWLTDSTLFDDSYARGEPLEFSLGSGQVISGWDRGLEGMKVGEIRRLALPSELAYGDRAVGP